MLHGNSTVTGNVTFEQTWKHGPVVITGILQGLDPNAKRGMHVQYAHIYFSLTLFVTDDISQSIWKRDRWVRFVRSSLQPVQQEPRSAQ